MHQDEQFCRNFADLLHVLYKLLLMVVMAFQHSNIFISQHLEHCSARNSKVITFNEYPKHISNYKAIDFFIEI